MKFTTVIKREDGFTIQEVLVVLIVGSILVGLSLSLFLFTNKLFLTWSGTSELKSETNRNLYQMAFDIQQSRELVELTDTSFVLSKSVGKVVRYGYNGKTIQRNDVDITPRKAATVRLKVVEEHVLGGNLDRSPLFHITVLVQSALLDYTAEIDAAPASSSRSLFIQSRLQ
jgi:competence protein ComGC